MKLLKQNVLPPLTGFLSAWAAAGLSLLTFVYANINGSSFFSQNVILSLSAMMTLSAFLLCTALLLCRRRLASSKKNRLLIPLFLAGAALAAGCAMLLAMAFDGNTAVSLVMICYMIICDLIVIIAFVVILLLVQWLLRRLGKNGDFLHRLRWQLLLSFVWFAAVFALLLIM